MPTVSVIIGVYNVEAYLRECLDSVVNQTIGLDELEVIAVDDGSTDGSGAILDEYAARYPQITVIHQANSGGPSRPRNVGLDRATGTYVYFLDSDDYLGTEALERMVAMARRNDSDIVLGKLAGVGGRAVPLAMFRRNVDRADLERDRVYVTLSALKLFRRALIERLGLRFPEWVSSGEDQPFTAQAYFAAQVISVVADYDCYYQRERPDSTTRGYVDPYERLARYTSLMELVGRNIEPGHKRDRLMIRHVWDVVGPFTERWLEMGPEDRNRLFEIAREIILRWHTDWIQRHLTYWYALRTHCLRHDMQRELEDIAGTPTDDALDNAILERQRVFAAFPHFRDGSGIPDSCFEITRQVVPRHRVESAVVEGGTLRLSGEAYLAMLGGSTDIVLRARGRGSKYRFPVEVRPTPRLRDRERTYPQAGFAVAVDLERAAAGAPLSAGTWDLFATIESRGIRRTVRLRAGDDAVPAAFGKNPATVGRSAHLYVTPGGYLSLRARRFGSADLWVERAVGLGRPFARYARRLFRRARRRVVTRA